MFGLQTGGVSKVPTRTWLPAGTTRHRASKGAGQLKGVDQQVYLQLIYETGQRPEKQVTALGLVLRQNLESGEQVTESFNIPERFFNCVVLDSQPMKSVPRRVRLAIERNIDERPTVDNGSHSGYWWLVRFRSQRDPHRFCNWLNTVRLGIPMTIFGPTFRTCREAASLWRGNRKSQPVHKSSACPATSPILLATGVVRGGLYISTTSTTDPTSGPSCNASKTASSSSSGARSERTRVLPTSFSTRSGSPANTTESGDSLL